jgi:hypothetical protein
MPLLGETCSSLRGWVSGGDVGAQWDPTDASLGPVSQAWTANVLSLLRQNTPSPYTAYQNYIDSDLSQSEWPAQVRSRHWG